MKKLFVIFSVLTIIALSSVTALAIDGDGSEETPFIITDQGELELVTDFPDCHFRLANDIELEGTWIPLCKQTSSGYFNGVFDGAGYTISNLMTDGSEGGLFKYNSGIIKDLNVIVAEEGMTGTGVIAATNKGNIFNCNVEGNIFGCFSYVGGICQSNKGNISKCKFKGIIENTYTGGTSFTGGICGYNSDDSNRTFSSIDNCVVIGNISGITYTGGICGYNYDEIINCYFIGNLIATGITGGIAGENNGYDSPNYTDHYKYISSIVDCYAAGDFGDGESYGIGKVGSGGEITTSYYDKTTSRLISTTHGTPKSTAAMKMKQTYVNDWDFDNVWGIDKSINNGYPYLLWEYANVEESPYTVNSVKLTDLLGNELEGIPTESFYFEIDVTKNDNSKNSDSLIIALYDEKGAFIDLKYMSGTYYQNQSITFGAMINKSDKNIGKIKAFVWDSVCGMQPLSNTMEITN